MHDSDRPERTPFVEQCFWAAWAVAIFALLVVIAFYPSSSSDNPTAYPEYYSKKCKEIEGSGVFFSKTDKPANAEEQGNTQQDSADEEPTGLDYCNLAAQYIAARGAETSGKWTIFASVVALFGLAALIGTLIQTSSINKTTREIGQKQVRAYLSVFMDKPGLWHHRLNTGEVQISGRVKVKNSGGSPANDIKVHVLYFYNGARIGRNVEFDGQFSFPSSLAPSEDHTFTPVDFIVIPEEISSFETEEFFSCEVRLIYRDVFRGKYDKPVCFRLRGGTHGAKHIQNALSRTRQHMGAEINADDIDMIWVRVEDPKEDADEQA